MYIYRITHRYYNIRPHDCADHTVGYYSTIEKAQTTIKDFLGKEATCNKDFGFEVWTSPYNKNTEYIIDMIEVW